ncbi:hypothetical protein EYF80_021067 [Liparis tanakae]|uniref:Uncharacterized protein n=1 Tax=Liparis tanakae TaxID=230148 RepID=A0A4Z2HTV6_9TELE|nr:hypothetical protein EYF80_021067 [Liparis tanakae]
MTLLPGVQSVPETPSQGAKHMYNILKTGGRSSTESLSVDLLEYVPLVSDTGEKRAESKSKRLDAT